MIVIVMMMVMITRPREAPAAPCRCNLDHGTNPDQTRDGRGGGAARVGGQLTDTLPRQLSARPPVQSRG